MIFLSILYLVIKHHLLKQQPVNKNVYLNNLTVLNEKIQQIYLHVYLHFKRLYHLSYIITL